LEGEGEKKIEGEGRSGIKKEKQERNEVRRKTREEKYHIFFL
jgi:hypothetical protein